jgi:hypothetical protein
VIEGAIRAQAFFMLQDPWANAYNPEYREPERLPKNERILGEPPRGLGPSMRARPLPAWAAPPPLPTARARASHLPAPHDQHAPHPPKNGRRPSRPRRLGVDAQFRARFHRVLPEPAVELVNGSGVEGAHA